MHELYSAGVTTHNNQDGADTSISGASYLNNMYSFGQPSIPNQQGTNVDLNQALEQEQEPTPTEEE